MNILSTGVFTVLEKLLHWSLHGKLRSHALRFLGARIGSGARINEVTLSGLWNGFENLSVGDKAFLGDSTFIDLTGEVRIGSRTSISPCCILITHQDPGSMLGNDLVKLFGRKAGNISIGNDSWIGAGTIILSGRSVGNRVIIGAGSLVTKDIPDNCIAYGRPAKVVKSI